MAFTDSRLDQLGITDTILTFYNCTPSQFDSDIQKMERGGGNPKPDARRLRSGSRQSRKSYGGETLGVLPRKTRHSLRSNDGEWKSEVEGLWTAAGLHSRRYVLNVTSRAKQKA